MFPIVLFLIFVAIGIFLGVTGRSMVLYEYEKQATNAYNYFVAIEVIIGFILLFYYLWFIKRIKRKISKSKYLYNMYLFQGVISELDNESLSELQSLIDDFNKLDFKE